MAARDEGLRRIHGLYGIADAGASRGDPEALGFALLEGGCRLVQLRCKGWKPTEIVRVARALQRRCRAAGATFIVNDSAEIAVEVDADGVHIGALDGEPADARRVLGSRRILGCSSDTPESATELAKIADYVAFGPIWATENDAGRGKQPRGIASFAEARALVPPTVPLVAIGGITADRVQDLIHSGASAWAVIGGIANAPDWTAATRAFAGLS